MKSNLQSMGGSGGAGGGCAGGGLGGADAAGHGTTASRADKEATPEWLHPANVGRPLPYDDPCKTM